MQKEYDDEIAQKIINYINEHKVSTTEVGDCLNKTGAVIGSNPMNKNMFRCGRIQYVYAHSNTNWPIHEQIRNVVEGSILYVDAINVFNRALFGELVTRYIIEKRKAIAIVTKGLMRDAAELLEMKAPIWCGGITPEGCFNQERDTTPEIRMIVKKNRAYYQDSIAVCDDCGVVVIPKDQINEEMLDKLVAIETQEKIWFHCVMDLDWNTYDTVCLKKYENLGTKHKS